MKLFLLFVLFVYFPFLVSFKLSPESRSWIGCISHHEALDIISCYDKNFKGKSIEYIGSIDLNFSKIRLLLTEEGINTNEENPKLISTWDELKLICSKKSGCYSLYDDGSQPWKISSISKKTSIPASLMPPIEASGAPTMVLGGFTMHRISGDSINPTIDTKAKINSITINNGYKVLDTCLGLGYTAIEAAKKVGMTGQVTSIEYDDVSIEMCSFNPYSQQLFDNTLLINILEGDACEIVKTFPDNSYNAIIHDPPARALCRTDLYGKQFYSQLYRILKKNGQLFHYIGNPLSKESGKLYSGITDRLRVVGFEDIIKVTDAFGLKAIKK